MSKRVRIVETVNQNAFRPTRPSAAPKAARRPCAIAVSPIFSPLPRASQRSAVNREKRRAANPSLQVAEKMSANATPATPPARGGCRLSPRRASQTRPSRRPEPQCRPPSGRDLLTRRPTNISMKMTTPPPAIAPKNAVDQCVSCARPLGKIIGDCVSVFIRLFSCLALFSFPRNFHPGTNSNSTAKPPHKKNPPPVFLFQKKSPRPQTPASALAYSSALNGAMSSAPSPSATNRTGTGDSSAASASKNPPFAVPSNFVTTVPETPTARENSRNCDKRVLPRRRVQSQQRLVRRPRHRLAGRARNLRRLRHQPRPRRQAARRCRSKQHPPPARLRTKPRQTPPTPDRPRRRK